MDPNGFTAPFQLTKTLHRDLYPTIDPSSPDLKAINKTVLINGASGGLGGEIARAWAQAGAKAMVLVARKAEGLAKPAEAIKAPSSSTKVFTTTADFKDEVSVASLFQRAESVVGKVSVVINAARAMNKDLGQERSNPLNGGAICQGTFIDLSSLSACFTVPGTSSYSTSKLAAIKLGEYLDTEKPNLRVFSLHPGIVAQTASKRGAVVDALTPFAQDKGIQAGGTTLYLATPRADYLRGSFLSVSWDLDEMAAHEKEIVDGKLLKLSFLNAKLSPDGHPWTP